MFVFAVVSQVEKRVVNLLAAAYEQGLITKGSEVELIVELQNDEGRPTIGLNVAGSQHSVSVNNVNTHLAPVYM